jgi:hypothetical protein
VVEVALAVALEAAAKAERWGIVAQLARELEARRAMPAHDQHGVIVPLRRVPPTRK